MIRSLLDHQVLTFDCYGTLIDWQTGIWDALQPLIVANRRNDVTRTAALAAFARHEPAQEAETPDLLYPLVLTGVHRRLAEHFDLETTDELDSAFGSSVPHWPAFPDAADALRSLGSRYRLVILSNVDNQSFAASNRKLGVRFDAVFTAEDIGSYKPNLANFEYMLARLAARFGFEHADVLHTAQSLYHDHVPAKRLGLTTAWVDRQRLSEGGEWGATAEVSDRPVPDHLFFTLAEMAAAVEAAA